jgi:hypothetical protein
MTELDELNHASVLRNLYTRYLKDEIYTYVGETLLAVNPFNLLNFEILWNFEYSANRYVAFSQRCLFCFKHEIRISDK